ncbi:uncharacterized protein LOC108810827 isoform X2 [Raphanus sativus]|uniref:Uncharacterized protein LOC108810827 isoform X2 n=1 Tax=Raphanus sativus TaxID=3726 RepID=A0A6J0JRU5_RAPSA|nr:uncharacterized protein LOC108810827 isoform X2 [Raphanus sativus]
MEVNEDYDDADEFFQSLFEQLEGLSLSEDTVAASTDPWNINALLEPLPPQFQKQAPPPSFDVAEVLENLDQLMGPDTLYTEDQSVQFGSNKKTIIAVVPTQRLFSSNPNQGCIAETSTSINPTLQGRSPSQDKRGLFTVPPPESIPFKPIESSSDISTADSDQQQPRKRQRR